MSLAAADAATPSATNGRPPSLRDAWRALAEPVEPFLLQVRAKLDAQVSAFEPEIRDLTRYALTNEGKQIRPVLVALSASALGKVNDSHATLAVIIEMVHLATLVHDDVMDHAGMRRGRPTLAARHGVEIAVLVGDCLFAHSVTLAAGFPTPDVCRAVAASTNRVCAGEVLQTAQRRKFNLTRAEYLRALEMKTGELFALSCEMGGFLSGGTPAERQALRDYGLALGTAYQIYDDCLDLYGNELAAGKSLGTDLLSGKITLPLLCVLENAPSAVRERVCGWLGAWNESLLPEMIELLGEFDALKVSSAAIHRFLMDAENAARQLPESPGRESLLGLCNLVLWQTEQLAAAC